MRLHTNTREEILAHRKEWITALRSGEYQQAREVLHDGHGYCCLGVACKVMGLEPQIMGDEQVHYFFNDEYLSLPAAGEEWLGVANGNPSLDFPWVESQDGSMAPRSVAEFNDAGFTFDQIADLIEYFGFATGEDILRGPW